MKTKIYLITILLIFSFLTVNAQEDIFEKLSNHEDITTVYISKSLLNLMPDVNTGGANIKGLTGKLEQLEIYNTEGSKDASKLMKQEIAGLVKSKKYEILMKVKEKDNNVTFYVYKEKERIKDLIMFVDDMDECSIIRVKGDFSAEDVQGVVGGAGSKSKKK